LTGTDFCISLSTGYYSYYIYHLPSFNKVIHKDVTFKNNHFIQSLSLRGCIFISIYSLSTFIAGILHYQYNGNISTLNTFTFRFHWWIVVTLTGMTGSAQGLLGVQFLQIQAALFSSSALTPTTNVIKRITQDDVWYLHSIIIALLVWFGYFSCIRPASDIFIAGTLFFLLYSSYFSSLNIVNTNV
jgi:hypothetical protein